MRRFAGILQTLETLSKLSYSFHTAEVRGSIRASPPLKKSIEVSISMFISRSPLAKLLTVLPLFASYEILPTHEESGRKSLGGGFRPQV
jgi:hypothetical protein